MSNELNIKNGLVVAGNSTVTGNEIVSGSLTILGATNFTASQAASASYAVTASFSQQLDPSATSSYALTASYALGVNNTIFATTASNTFVGTEIISGSLIISGSAIINSIVSSAMTPVASYDYGYNCYVGVGALPGITYLGNGTMSFDGSGSARFYRNAINQGTILNCKLTAQQVIVPVNIPAYINVQFVSDGTGSYYVTTNSDDANYSNTVPFLVTYIFPHDVYPPQLISRGQESRGAPAKNLHRISDTNPVAREKGLILGMSGSGTQVIQVSPGTIWYNLTEIDFPQFYSNQGTPNAFFLGFFSGSQSVIVPATTVSNTMFDLGDGTGPQPLPSGGYNTVWVYQMMSSVSETSSSCVYILGPQSSSFSDASAAGPPLNVASVLQEMGVLLGRIIFQVRFR